MLSKKGFLKFKRHPISSNILPWPWVFVVYWENRFSLGFSHRYVYGVFILECFYRLIIIVGARANNSWCWGLKTHSLWIEMGFRKLSDWLCLEWVIVPRAWLIAFLDFLLIKSVDFGLEAWAWGFYFLRLGLIGSRPRYWFFLLFFSFCLSFFPI